MMTGFGLDDVTVQPIIQTQNGHCYGSTQYYQADRLPNSGAYGFLEMPFPGIVSSGNNQPRVTYNGGDFLPSYSPLNHISHQYQFNPHSMQPQYHTYEQNQIPTSSPYVPFNGQMGYMPQAHPQHLRHDCNTESCNNVCQAEDYHQIGFYSQQSPFEVESYHRDLSPFMAPVELTRPHSQATHAEEDLEVELINRSSEQLAEQIRLSNEKEIESFLSAQSNPTSSKGTTCSETASSNPTPARQPYAKKLSASSQKNSVDLTASVVTPVFVSPPLFTHTEIESPLFYPLLTPKSDAILKRKLNEYEKRHKKAAIRKPDTRLFADEKYDFPIRLPDPTLPRGLFDRSCAFPEPSETPAYSHHPSAPFDFELDLSEQLLTPRFLKQRQEFLQEEENKAGPSKKSTREEEFEDKSQELALDVVEKLLSGANNTIESPARVHHKHKFESSDDAFRAKINKSLVSHSLDIALRRATSFGPPISMDEPSSSTADSWEDMEEKDLVANFEAKMKLTIDDRKAKALLNPHQSNSHHRSRNAALYNLQMRPHSPNLDWDPKLLPFVLEAYGIPEYVIQDNLSNVLASIGHGNATVKWIDRKMVFVVFETPEQATIAASLPRHEWLCFRTLSQSPKCVQEYALNNQESFSRLNRKSAKRPTTNVSAARRTVEFHLQKKSTVSKEKLEEEKKQLAEARKAAAYKKSAWND